MGTVDLDLCVDRPPPTAHRVILSLTHSVNNGRDVVVLGVRIFFATYERSRRPAWGAHVCSRWVPPGKPVVQGFLRPGRMGLAFTRGPRCRGRHTWNAWMLCEFGINLARRRPSLCAGAADNLHCLGRVLSRLCCELAKS